MLASLRSATFEGLQAGVLEAASGDPRTVRILAKSIYRELRHSGLDEQGVMALAGELLGLLTSDVKDRRERDARPSEGPPNSGTWAAYEATGRGSACPSEGPPSSGTWVASAVPERED